MKNPSPKKIIHKQSNRLSDILQLGGMVFFSMAVVASLLGLLLYREGISPIALLTGANLSAARIEPTPLPMVALQTIEAPSYQVLLGPDTPTPHFTAPAPPTAERLGDSAGTASRPTLTPTPFSASFVDGQAVARTVLPSATPLPPVDIPPVLSAGSPQPAKPVTRIVIPALGLDTSVLLAPIRENTWDVSHLEQEVGHLEGTASVGVTSNVVLAGHVTLAPDGRDGPFIALSQVEPGTVVTVYHGEEAFTYQIETLRSVKPTDIEVTFPTTEARLTLITCLNYDPELGRYSDRLVAVGRLLP